MERRSFIAGGVLGSMVGVPSTLMAKASQVVSKDEQRGWIDISIDVGNLPPFRAEAYIERLKEKFSDAKPKNWNFIIRANRCEGTSVSVYVLQDGAEKEIEPFITELGGSIKLNDKEPSDQEIKDYVLLHLGVPVVKIDQDVLDHINVIIEEAQGYGVKKIKEYVANKTREHSFIWKDKYENTYCSLRYLSNHLWGRG